MDFIDPNGTFLGIILTLNVLCIFAQKDNNFILRILLELRKLLENALEAEKTSVNSRLDQFQKSESFKIIEDIANGDIKCSDPEAFSTASKISYDYTVSSKNLKADLSPCYLTMDHIDLAKEQFRAPFFTLIFGIVMFSLNLVCSWFLPDTELLILPGVWLFVILSYIYWIAIWTSFCCRNMQNTDNGIKNSWWRIIDNKVGIKLGTTLKILICASVATIVLLALDIESIQKFWSFAIVMSLMVLLISIIGIWRLIHCGVKGQYSIRHSLGHLLAFMIYSICLAIVYDIFAADTCSHLFNNTKSLSSIITLFALFNGIVAPFLLPYLKYKSSYNRAMESIQNTKIAIDESIDKFGKEYDNLAKKFFSRSFSKKK